MGVLREDCEREDSKVVMEDDVDLWTKCHTILHEGRYLINKTYSSTLIWSLHELVESPQCPVRSSMVCSYGPRDAALRQGSSCICEMCAPN